MGQVAASGLVSIMEAQVVGVETASVGQQEAGLQVIVETIGITTQPFAITTFVQGK